MEDCSNIARFDEYTGKIFAALYQRFPEPLLLQTHEYVESPTEFSDFLGCDTASKESEFFCHTVVWLEKAGYIETEEVDGRYLYVQGVVLTAKGLEVLNIQPDSLEQRVSLGSRITRATREEGVEMLRGLVREALSAGAKMMVYGS